RASPPFKSELFLGVASTADERFFILARLDGVVLAAAENGPSLHNFVAAPPAGCLLAGRAGKFVRCKPFGGREEHRLWRLQDRSLKGSSVFLRTTLRDLLSSP